MPRRLTDEEWMSRLVERAGSQAAAARVLGISASMVGKIVRGQRNGAKWREAARAGARGRPVTPPVPEGRRRTRRPARRPLPDGGSRVATGSPALAARELQRTVNLGRVPSEVVITVRGVPRTSGTPERGRGGGTFRPRQRQRPSWSGPVALGDLTEDEMARLAGASNGDDVLDVVRERDEWRWLGTGGRVERITFVDSQA